MGDIMTDQIELLRNQYYDAIKLLFCTDETEDEILNLLQKPDYADFFPIIDGLLAKLKKKKKSILSLIKEKSFLPALSKRAATESRSEKTEQTENSIVVICQIFRKKTP